MDASYLNLCQGAGINAGDQRGSSRQGTLAKRSFRECVPEREFGNEGEARGRRAVPPLACTSSRLLRGCGKVVFGAVGIKRRFA
jgi:hypothetical protein